MERREKAPQLAGLVGGEQPGGPGGQLGAPERAEEKAGGGRLVALPASPKTRTSSRMISMKVSELTTIAASRPPRCTACSPSSSWHMASTWLAFGQLHHVAANIVLIDPKAKRTITDGGASKSENQPYRGMTLPGVVVHTIFDGEFTVRDSKLAR